MARKQNRMNAPSLPAWIVSVLLGGLGVAAHLGLIAALAPYAFWLVAIGLIVLVLATALRGL